MNCEAVNYTSPIITRHSVSGIYLKQLPVDPDPHYDGIRVDPSCGYDSQGAKTYKSPTCQKIMDNNGMQMTNAERATHRFVFKKIFDSL